MMTTSNATRITNTTTPTTIPTIAPVDSPPTLLESVPLVDMVVDMVMTILPSVGSPEPEPLIVSLPSSPGIIVVGNVVV